MSDTVTLTEVDIRHLAAGQIIPSDDNLRESMDATSLMQLAVSIVSEGLLEPLVVKPHPELDNHFLIIAGHRRFAAMYLAHEKIESFNLGESLIPCIVRQADDADTAIGMLIENLMREDLDPIEEAKGYARLTGFNMTQRDIARRTGVPAPHISKRLTLLQLPDEAHALIRSGDLTIETALDLAKLEDAAKVKHFLAHGFSSYELRHVLQTQEQAKAMAAARDKVEAAGHTVVTQEEIAEQGYYVVFGREVPVAELDKLKVPARAKGVEIVVHYGGGEAVVRPLSLKKIPKSKPSEVLSNPTATAADRKAAEKLQRAQDRARKAHNREALAEIVGQAKKADAVELVFRYMAMEVTTHNAQPVCQLLGIDPIVTVSPKREWKGGQMVDVEGKTTTTRDWVQAVRTYAAKGNGMAALRVALAVTLARGFSGFERITTWPEEFAAATRAFLDSHGFEAYDPERAAIADPDEDGDEGEDAE